VPDKIYRISFSSIRTYSFGKGIELFLTLLIDDITINGKRIDRKRETTRERAKKSEEYELCHTLIRALILEGYDNEPLEFGVSILNNYNLIQPFRRFLVTDDENFFKGDHQANTRLAEKMYLEELNDETIISGDDNEYLEKPTDEFKELFVEEEEEEEEEEGEGEVPELPEPEEEEPAPEQPPVVLAVVPRKERLQTYRNTIIDDIYDYVIKVDNEYERFVSDVHKYINKNKDLGFLSLSNVISEMSNIENPLDIDFKDMITGISVVFDITSEVKKGYTEPPDLPHKGYSEEITLVYRLIKSDFDERKYVLIDFPKEGKINKNKSTHPGELFEYSIHTLLKWAFEDLDFYYFDDLKEIHVKARRNIEDDIFKEDLLTEEQLEEKADEFVGTLADIYDLIKLIMSAENYKLDDTDDEDIIENLIEELGPNIRAVIKEAKRMLSNRIVRKDEGEFNFGIELLLLLKRIAKDDAGKTIQQKWKDDKNKGIFELPQYKEEFLKYKNWLVAYNGDIDKVFEEFKEAEKVPTLDVKTGVEDRGVFKEFILKLIDEETIDPKYDLKDLSKVEDIL